jgi:alpha,alpha-trehalase
VPYNDNFAMKYYNDVMEKRKHLKISVIQLPETITPQYVKSLNQRPGILSLALKRESGTVRGVPFVVPGGRFNEMYGWDSYFEALGLLVDNRVELAKGMADNFLYQIEHYGKILNANRSYYLTRSQPPFLTDMSLQVFKNLKGTIGERNVWMGKCMRASVKELFSVWLSPPRLDPIGLSKFHPEGIGMPPETEASHFNHIIEPFAAAKGLDIETYSRMYANDEIKEPKLDKYFVHDRAVRESGHDTTYRLEKKCADLCTVELNALVYKYECDIAEYINGLGGSMKLRVRRGPEDIYLKKYEKWARSVEKKGVKNMLSSGGWDGSWAKGVMIYDAAIDDEIREVSRRKG